MKWNWKRMINTQIFTLRTTTCAHRTSFCSNNIWVIFHTRPKEKIKKMKKILWEKLSDCPLHNLFPFNAHTFVELTEEQRTHRHPTSMFVILLNWNAFFPSAQHSTTSISNSSQYKSASWAIRMVERNEWILFFCVDRNAQNDKAMNNENIEWSKTIQL